MNREQDRTDYFDPGKYYSASAYTTPADSNRTGRYQRRSLLLSMLAGACIMAVIASFAYMFFFNFSFLRSQQIRDIISGTERR